MGLKLADRYGLRRLASMLSVRNAIAKVLDSTTLAQMRDADEEVLPLELQATVSIRAAGRPNGPHRRGVRALRT